MCMCIKQLANILPENQCIVHIIIIPTEVRSLFFGGGGELGCFFVFVF